MQLSDNTKMHVIMLKTPTLRYPIAVYADRDAAYKMLAGLKNDAPTHCTYYMDFALFHTGE